MTGLGSSERRDWPTAVVVGAGGLGTAVARRLGLSHRLLLADLDADHVGRLCSVLRADGYDAEPVVCDVTQASAIAGLAAAASARQGVKVLANVVGLSPAAKDFRAIMAVNLIGAATIAEAFVDVLDPGGAAVFVSSSAAHMLKPGEEVLRLLDNPLKTGIVDALAEALGAGGANANQAYTLSKIGLNRLCKRQAVIWGQRGLRIVSISPGLIATPQGAEAYKHSAGKISLFEAIPLGRECSMLEIAGLVAFLASDGASYITGTDILADGGLVAATRRDA